MKITNDIVYVGVNDRELDLFEAHFTVPNGMAYNSYVILDDKIAVMDSVAEGFGDEWLKKLSDATGGRAPDYLIVQHMEPDHSANIAAFAALYPDAVIVSSSRSFTMMKNFYGDDFAGRRIEAADGKTLSLGRHTLRFISAPMVHWPEVTMTFDETDRVLFSADAFGKFGTLDTDEDWACEARRYYFGIVGKFGGQVARVLDRIEGLGVTAICPLHGPYITDNIGYYTGLYRIWSSYGVESEGVTIAYTSVYGHTKKVAERLAEVLKEKGCPKVAMQDLVRDDTAEAVEDAFRYGKLVLATTTYYGDIFPPMKEFIDHLVFRGYKGRRIGFIENGSWFPQAAGVMKKLLAECKDIDYCRTNVRIVSAPDAGTEAQIEALADELLG